MSETVIQDPFVGTKSEIKKGRDLADLFKQAAIKDCRFRYAHLFNGPVLVSREYEKSGRLFDNKVMGTITQRLEAVPHHDGTYDIYFRNKLFYDHGKKFIMETNPLNHWQDYNGVDIATKYPSNHGFSLDEVKSLFCEYEQSCQFDKPIPMTALQQNSYWFRPLLQLKVEAVQSNSFDPSCVLKALNIFNYSLIGPLLGHTPNHSMISQGI